jgi:hypothetical protein
VSGARGARLLLVLAALGGCRRAPAPPPKTTSRWVSPLPQGNSLHAVWVAQSGDVLAAGDGGTLVRFNAAEQRWTVRELVDVVLVALRGSDDGRVFVGGQKGTLLVSRDRGATGPGPRGPSVETAGCQNLVGDGAEDAVREPHFDLRERPLGHGAG